MPDLFVGGHLVYEINLLLIQSTHIIESRIYFTLCCRVMYFFCLSVHNKICLSPLGLCLGDSACLITMRP